MNSDLISGGHSDVFLPTSLRTVTVVRHLELKRQLLATCAAYDALDDMPTHTTSFLKTLLVEDEAALKTQVKSHLDTHSSSYRAHNFLRESYADATVTTMLSAILNCEAGVSRRKIQSEKRHTTFKHGQDLWERFQHQAKVKSEEAAVGDNSEAVASSNVVGASAKPAAGRKPDCYINLPGAYTEDAEGNRHSIDEWQAVYIVDSDSDEKSGEENEL